MKNKKYDIVGPFTKFGRKIVERGKIDIPPTNKYMIVYFTILVHD